MYAPVILEGKWVRLLPLDAAHRDRLIAAASDGELWNLMTTSVPNEQTIDAYIELRLAQFASGAELPFVTIKKDSNEIVGATRFMDTSFLHKRVEIGGTWLAKSAQRTPINTEAKLLMLRHAFEVLEMNRVMIKTDFLNHQSRRAIERLGAKEEGVLRNHVIMQNGRVRDTIVYSIIKNEWAGVEQYLLHKLDRTLNE